MLKKENRIQTETLRGFRQRSISVSEIENGVSATLHHESLGSGGKKFGVSCSKKICETSIERNRVRRIVYSTLEKELQNIKAGVIGLFSIKKYGGNEIKLKEIVQSLLKKSGLVSNNK